LAAVVPVDHYDAALRIARVRWRVALNAEDRMAEAAAMDQLNRLLEDRLTSMRHASTQLAS
jgi:hypothetical protein